MYTPLDNAELDLVVAVLIVVPEATAITVYLTESTEVPEWDPMVVLTVGALGALEALEIDDDVMAAFSVAHPPAGRYVIKVDAALTAPLASPIPLPLSSPSPAAEPTSFPLAAS